MDANGETLVASPQRDLDLAPEAEPITDDDRSSSLSELDDGSDTANAQLLPFTSTVDDEDDSEAETERLESSPQKLLAQRNAVINSSRVAQVTVSQKSPDMERFSDSAISSPISSDIDQLSDDPGDEEDLAANGANHYNPEVPPPSAKKRKRSMLDDVIEGEQDDDSSIRRKRTRSLGSDDENSSVGSDIDEDEKIEDTREATVEPEDDNQDEDGELENIRDEDRTQETKALAKKSPRRTSRRKSPSVDIPDGDPTVVTEVDAAEESGEDESAEVEDAADDDGEAAAKSGEEYAKRMAAMDDLTAIEKRFATLKDRLYDERIAEINHELAQLANPKPTHPELLKQIECVRKYRDEKFVHEQKLLVYKVGALKRKSVAERSQIHSAYFQTIRDMREDHLERATEHFYRIQRDRFKTEKRVPDFSIPFPDRRPAQIAQQMAYNKEVSILSGVAKHVGFPAAPDLANARDKELEDDLEQLGLSPVQVRTTRQPQKVPIIIPYGNALITRPAAAEEDWTTQHAWANPQHPAHRQHLQMSRQASNHSPTNEQVTPAHQQRPVDNTVAAGSASTIQDPSAQLSSVNNTPRDEQADLRNGTSTQANYRLRSSSPFGTRRISSLVNVDRTARETQASSPLAPRAVVPANAISPPRLSDALADGMARHDTASPSLINKFGRESGIPASTGVSRFKV